MKTLAVDAQGKPLYSTDAKGAEVYTAYDALNRPTDIWARDAAAEAVTLRQHMVYGDAAHPDPLPGNHLGKLWKHYDEAGLATITAYDFKGNPLEKVRQVVADTELTGQEKYVIDWTGLAVPLEMSNRINKQLYATMASIDWSNFFGTGIFDYTSGFSMVVIFLGVVSSLIYFFFSKAHSGAIGGIAKFGIWILMIGFGATFGFTVMARISLFINRLQFLRRSWMQVAFDESQANHGTLIVIFWATVALVVAYIVWEIVKSIMVRRKTVSQ